MEGALANSERTACSLPGRLCRERRAAQAHASARVLPELFSFVQLPDGEVFYVISNGRNQMGAYGANITVEDRWAIVAYLRALQLSRNAPVGQLPAELREKLMAGGTAK